MADTGSRVAGPIILTTGAVTYYTVPPATTFHMLHYRICNESDTVTARVTMSIGADGAGKRLHKKQAIPANGVLDWTGFEVLAAAEIIQALSDTAAALTLTISGVLVT